jgi:capsular polysaccharide biosynthesis protein
MQLRDVLRTIRRNWIAIVATLVVCLVVGLVIAVLTPSKYTSETKVLVKPELSSANPSSVAGAATFVTAEIPTLTELTTTAAVLDPAAQQLGLKNGGASLQNNVDASATVKTAIITITTTAGTPKGAAELANAVAGSLIKQIQGIGSASATIGLTGTVIEAPIVPTSPNSPVFVIDLLVALAVGIAIAFLFVVTRESLRSSGPRSPESRGGTQLRAGDLLSEP